MNGYRKLMSQAGRSSSILILEERKAGNINFRIMKLEEWQTEDRADCWWGKGTEFCKKLYTIAWDAPHCLYSYLFHRTHTIFLHVSVGDTACSCLILMDQQSQPPSFAVTVHIPPGTSSSEKIKCTPSHLQCHNRDTITNKLIASEATKTIPLGLIHV